MASGSSLAVMALLAAVLLFTAVVVDGHGDPPRLMSLVKKNPKGALLCPEGETLDLSGNDAAQNPGCTPCGALLQYACDGRRCRRWLKVVDNDGARQPICIQDDNFQIKTNRRTARGKHSNKGGGATIGVTQEVGCGLPGYGCCSGDVCELGSVCVGVTCVV